MLAIADLREPARAAGTWAGRRASEGEVPPLSDLPVRPRVSVPAAAGGGRLAPANLSDLAVGQEWLAEQLAAQGGWLLASPIGTKRSRQRPPPWLVGKRRRVETVLGQLIGRYQLRRVWARDRWHLWSRRLGDAGLLGHLLQGAPPATMVTVPGCGPADCR